MGKKKIAVFLNGYCSDIVTQFFDGFSKGIEDCGIDVYCFCAYPASYLGDAENAAELNIFNLPRLEDFNLAILIDNGIDYLNIYEIVHQRCLDAHIPFITTAHSTKEGFFVSSDNLVGTHELIDYVLDVLKCKDVAYVAGSIQNPDSNLRLSILREAMENRGLKLPMDGTRVHYTGWKLQSAMDFAGVLSRENNIPEIFICVNDDIAMALCNGLEKLGIRVPEDVMVTGFDNGYYSKIFYPSISTVDQRFSEIGSICARLSIEIIEGKTEKKEIIVGSRFINRESTKGQPDEEVSLLKKNIGKKAFEKRFDDAALYRRIDAIERDILLAESLEQVHDNMVAETELENYSDGGLHILLDSVYVNNLSEKLDNFRNFDCSKDYCVLYARENNVVYDSFIMPREQLIPYVDEGDKNRYFIFSSLRERDKVFGYMVLSERLDIINLKADLCRFAETVSISLGRLLQRVQVNTLNKRLMSLSSTDSMTAVKNRTAYEQKEKEYGALIESGSNFADFSLAVFDVNNLKRINDFYGHEKGDVYIIAACNLLCQAYKHSPVFRIGGDEFVVILTGEDENNSDSIFKSLQEEMKRISQMDIREYEKVSMAGGIAKYIPGQDKCFSDVFNRADAIMYENKKSMKSRRGKG